MHCAPGALDSLAGTHHERGELPKLQQSGLLASPEQSALAVHMRSV
jgi:hypothetical protein